MSALKDIIRKHVLKNAYDYGKANAGAVVGKVVAECPVAKEDMRATMKVITAVIQEVSTLSKREITREMKKYEYAKKDEKEKSFELPDAEKGLVITRFAPEPSGYPHIGHAKAAFLEYEAVKVYGGRMVLRFDDTNPEKESQEYVDAIKAGLQWLSIPWQEETYTSDHMIEIYETAERLIQAGKAYVCICQKDAIQESRKEGKACACRKADVTRNMHFWKEMLGRKFEQGSAILRFKGDMRADNTVMRDPTLARIVIASHFRQYRKYGVWPSYDLAVVVMDHIEGTTHSMRSKEYELRNELYYALFDALGWKRPVMIVFSRLAIKNAPLSKRLLAPLVREGKVMGWDDPRLPTLDGLKRRGILSEVIKNFVLSFGLSKVESEPDWEKLLAENRKVVDQLAPRYFFVADPVRVTIKNASLQKIKLRRHPKTDLGWRELTIGSVIYISKDDLESAMHGIFRLKDFCNLKMLSESEPYLAGYAGEARVATKIQWVPEERIACEIIIPGELLKDENYNSESLKILRGYCEKNCEQLNVGDIIQFERFGFCRLDAKTPKKLTFIYSC